MAEHSRAQDSEAMEITLEDFIDNREFDTNEVVITVIGKRATQCSWDDIQVTLNRTIGPAEDGFHQVYRLEDPTRWFLITKFNKPEADLVNNTTKTVNNQPFSLHFKQQ